MARAWPIAVAADEGDEIDVAERGRADEERRGDVDALVAKAPDERGGRVGAFGESGGDVALRFDGDEVEQRKGEVLELGDLAPRRAGQRAERRDRRAKQPFGLLRLALDRDLTEVGEDTSDTPDAHLLMHMILSEKPATFSRTRSIGTGERADCLASINFKLAAIR